MEFINLKQSEMSPKDYGLKFHHLSYYALELISSMRARMRKFNYGLSHNLVLESKAALLNKAMDISQLVIYIQ